MRKQTKKSNGIWTTAEEFSDTGGLGRKPAINHPREQLADPIDHDEEFRD